MLRLFDSASGEVRELALREPGRCSMYVCGPTVYDYPHLGHGRYALVFDVLRRYLEFTGLEVDFVSNITDVDDKIIERAAREGKSEAELAYEYELRWWEAMDALGVKRPTQTPHATAYIAGMVDLVSRLLSDGKAYATSDGVYLDVSQVPGYGLLAGQPLEDLRSGARVEANDEKRSPLDFALWKLAKAGEPAWPAPFGDGRPGWHTECVVMSLDLLGEGFDLHGGGMDLKFPHHENERAQAVAEGKAFAAHWVHNGWVVVEGEKMSKSLNNFTSLTDLLEKSDARAYRLLVLRSHYRSPVEVTADTIADAERGLDRLDAFGRRFGEVGEGALDGDAVAAFSTAMDADLDSPKALAGIFELVGRANAAADAGDDAARVLARTATRLLAVLGIALELGGGVVDDPTAELMAQRDAARAAKDFATADALRDELEAIGWVVEDSAEGTKVRRA